MSDNNYDTDFGPSTPGALNVISGYDGSSYAVSPSATDPTTASHVTAGSVAYVGPGGVLDFFTFPHFRPVILNPTTGEVVNNSPF